MKIERIIVTGATGAIGIALVSRALRIGLHVTCIVHAGSRRLGNLPVHERLEIVECNLSDYKTLKLQGRFDAFFHLSWDKTFGQSRDDAYVQSRNIEYTLDAVQLADRFGCQVFVGTGSQAEYGPARTDLTEAMPVQPESGYGIAKFAAGQLSAMLCKQLGLRHVWVRILSIYGPHDGEGTLISYLLRELTAGRSPELTRCEQIWDYLYADDAAGAMLALAEKGKDGKVYPLGSGVGRKLSDYVEDIRQIVAPNVPIHYGAKDYYPHQPMHLVADISSLTTDTGWTPKTTFQEGIKHLLCSKS